MKRTIILSLLAVGLIVVSTVRAHEKVKLNGYLVAVVCAADHTKDCALMEECVKSGYGIFADGKWYPFDAKGNTLAKAIFEKTAKNDRIKVTVDGMKHEGKILVDKLSETD